MKKKRSQRTVIAFVVGGLVLFALLGYFVLVRPQGAKASELDAQIAATQQEIEKSCRLMLEASQRAPAIRVADLFRLTTAMPDQPDMPGMLLELNQIAADAGIRFDSITPQPAVALAGYQAIPVTVVFDGNFYSLSDFLYRLRTLVRVRRGELAATGRTYAVDSIEFSESQKQFPNITATLTIDAFVYGTGTGAPPSAAPTTTTATSPASTTETTPSPSTPPSPPEGATAAGATS